eukprot:INCI17138.2.p1 GENE.INCI17138.2~~INCI17138.2.p1  ORF type:complete len:349 (-),score=49.27 INCI17138.2:1012-2058(-)
MINSLVRAASARPRLALRRCFSHKVITSEVSPELLVNASMGWGETFADNEGLCEYLRSSKTVTSDRVLDVVSALDRKWFTPQYAAELRERANPQKSAASLPTDYYDLNKPLKIGFGATMSSPQSHIQALELLVDHLKPGGRALDVGSGTGYLTACMAYLVHPRGGSATGLEHMKELASFAAHVVDELNTTPPASLESHVPLRCDFRDMNALTEFSRDLASESFDCIHFGAATADIPSSFVDILAPGGRLLVPLGRPDEEQVLTAVDKSGDGRFTVVSEITKTTFSPLHQHRDEQWQDRAARLVRVTAQLQKWRDTFAKENGGRNPSAAELASEPLFKEFQELRRALKR